MTAAPTPATRTNRAMWVCVALFALTVAQLLLALLAPSLPQFRGKAFGARTIAYPVIMLLLPVVRRITHRRESDHLGWAASALVMAPFFIDVSGNTLNLYDRISWWDDMCHFVNWALLLSGLGLLIDSRGQATRPVRALAIAGLGAILAIVWELGEWFTFIRFGTERDTAYTDTLGDLTLGTLGGTLAAFIVTRRGAHAPMARPTL